MSVINITIPARNEDIILEKSICELLDFCKKNLTDDWFVVLVDSASTDKTAEIRHRLSNNSDYSPFCHPESPIHRGRRIPLSSYQAETQRDSSAFGLRMTVVGQSGLKYIYNSQPGKGRAIRAGWTNFPADYYVFMDADLSTDLEAMPRLIQELKTGMDVVIGSRYLPTAQTQRSLIRLFISKTYRLLARTLLSMPFSDLPCGFKGINDRAKQELLPLIKNEEWFFDTEMLYRAWKKGYLIKEIPVRWTENPSAWRKSRVGIFKVSWNYIKELIKLKTSP